MSDRSLNRNRHSINREKDVKKSTVHSNYNYNKYLNRKNEINIIKNLIEKINPTTKIKSKLKFLIFKVEKNYSSIRFSENCELFAKHKVDINTSVAQTQKPLDVMTCLP
jgi:hypothetical protein